MNFSCHTLHPIRLSSHCLYHMEPGRFGANGGQCSSVYAHLCMHCMTWNTGFPDASSCQLFWVGVVAVVQQPHVSMSVPVPGWLRVKMGSDLFKWHVLFVAPYSLLIPCPMYPSILSVSFWLYVPAVWVLLVPPVPPVPHVPHVPHGPQIPFRGSKLMLQLITLAHSSSGLFRSPCAPVCSVCDLFLQKVRCFYWRGWGENAKSRRGRNDVRSLSFFHRTFSLSFCSICMYMFLRLVCIMTQNEWENLSHRKSLRRTWRWRWRDENEAAAKKRRL